MSAAIRPGLRILVRGGGDLAGGVILRCVRAGWRVLITELPQPRAVRRSVAFGEAVYDGHITIEGVTARRVNQWDEAEAAWAVGEIPVWVDPAAETRHRFDPEVMIDARMCKQPPELSHPAAAFVIGLGPGFWAGENCHTVIETMRGPYLGRVIWHGSAADDTGIPEQVAGHQSERVLRSPCDGMVESVAAIGAFLQTGDAVARVKDQIVTAPFDGVLRGLIRSGIIVSSGEKIGDLDPRNDPLLCGYVSDKSLAIGGGVLEAILTWLRHGCD